MYDEIKNMSIQREDKKLTKKYTPLAKDYLMQKYTQEKRAAEIETKRTGKTVNYSDFVKRVDARVDKGYTPFDERDIKNTVEMMKNLKKQGNEPRNLLTTEIEGQRDEKIKIKQHDLEGRIEYEKQNIEVRRRENEEKISRNIKADKNSKHYSRKEAIKSIIRESEKEAAAAMSEYPTPEVFPGYDEIIISSKNDSGLGEIEREKEDKAFREMKKQENQQLQEKRKVVNGKEEGFRPIGKIIRRERPELRTVDVATKTDTNTVNKNDEVRREN
ncbi:hypothetical protein, partial [Caldisalinibacter kiritimatiensis]|uniref:hypothetical protein n=1 Tax=Caldisalinibacter kiritimatiensis TaxID=1304284 RepID=UPI00054CE62F